MLFSLGHGQHIILPPTGGVENAVPPPGTVPLSTVAPGAKLGDIARGGVEAGLAGTDARSFGYLFPDADGVPGDGTATVDALKALAVAMTEGDGDPDGANSSIPPFITYFGQFIDHDITANTDRDAPQPNPISVMTGTSVPPLPRDQVVDNIVNLRNGTLQLDSLYGEGPTDTDFTKKLREAMRDPVDRSKMRLGGVEFVGATVDLPADGMQDLPRLGDVVADPQSGLTIADMEGLEPGPFKEGFIKDGAVNAPRALIGDGRNDENLIVAQVHLAFLRLHNAIADDLAGEIADAETRFEEAKRRTMLIYQWMVVNLYLPAVCLPAVVDQVKADGALLYKAFQERVAAAGELPLPLEFSVAAFRFGHSMIRAVYDHNRNFPQATFKELFSFTGGDKLGITAIGQGFDRLPSNWPIDWSRFIGADPVEPKRMARKIDTMLAPPLSDMFKESDAGGELQRILRNLAERNLRRGHRFNIPSGQACVAAINAFDTTNATALESGGCKDVSRPDYSDHESPADGDGIVPLPVDVLNEGAAGMALTDGGMLEATPLWYYCLREAEVTQGDTLGPLGSRIVAETLIGLVLQDEHSYWHEGGGGGKWTPAEVPVGGLALTDVSAMLRAAGLL